MHMSKNNIFKENFQRYIDGFYSKNELESILKQIKNYCTDEDIDQLAEQLWSNLGDETLANRFEKSRAFWIISVWATLRPVRNK